MTTDCIGRRYEFQGVGRREILAGFDGGRISSDGGVVLLREVDRCRSIVERFVACFVDARDPGAIEHTVEELLRQRVFALALGCEDLNDHDELRRDALLAAVVGKQDPTGQDRRRERDRGRALAGKSTLNRLEWGVSGEIGKDRYRRIAVDGEAVDRFFVELFLDSVAKAPEQIILDCDATDDLIHGNQEGRFFHGDYGGYCYLPLYIFCGDHLLLARLRRANLDASSGCVEEVERIVAQIRERWPKTAILVRGDSGFAREALMSWCEENRVDYVFGLAKNPRLQAALEPAFERAHRRCELSGQPERVYSEWQHSTLDSWSRERRVIGKAEITLRGENPRFVVTSLSRRKAGARRLYEEIYCARGEMENRIKEQQLDLFADRTSARQMRVNQLRLWLSSVAYTLLSELRRLGLAGTAFARARCSTIRLKLLKIGALVRVTVRKVWVSMASGYPYEALFAHAYDQLRRAGPAPA